MVSKWWILIGGIAGDDLHKFIDFGPWHLIALENEVGKLEFPAVIVRVIYQWLAIFVNRRW